MWYMYIICLQDEWRQLIAGGTHTPKKLPNPTTGWLSNRSWADFLTLPALSNFATIAEEFGEMQDGFKRMFDSTQPHK